MRRIKWVAVLLALGTAVGCARKQADTPPPKDPEVEVVEPVFHEINDYEDFTGRTDTTESVDVKARIVTGFLDTIKFKDGDNVKKGEVLCEIDPRPYKADLDQAMAQERLAQAQVKFGKSDYDRYVRLHAQGSATNEDVEKALQALEVAKAQVDVAKSQVATRQLYLSFTKVRAPFDGRLSRRFVDPRNIVMGDTTVLTRIVSLNPMYAYFDVDERTRMRIARLIRKGEIPSYRADKNKLPIWMGLADEQDTKVEESPYRGYPHKGGLDFVDNRMDEGTGTLRVRAIFDNANGLILPGQFARIRLPVGKPYKALQVPEGALGTDQGVKFVYVVNKENKVEYRQVRVGPMHGGLRVIVKEDKPDKGVREGERVIVGGLQRVRPNIKVTIRAPKKDQKSGANIEPSGK